MSRGVDASRDPTVTRSTWKSWMISRHRGRQVAMADVDPVHPGEILDRDFREPLGVSRDALADARGDRIAHLLPRGRGEPSDG
jgi:hypothetical protein